MKSIFGLGLFFVAFSALADSTLQIECVGTRNMDRQFTGYVFEGDLKLIKILAQNSQPIVRGVTKVAGYPNDERSVYIVNGTAETLMVPSYVLQGEQGQIETQSEFYNCSI